MDVPTGIVTFLFTDIEGSSAKWEGDRAAMQAAVATHDRLLTEAVAANDGHLVKKLGDGIMASFADPADALSAAVEGRRALAAADFDAAVGAIRVRMGIHTGPATSVDGDYLGPALNRAARIEAAGHGGQILLSAASRELAADRVEGLLFTDLGQHQLRGLSRPERIFQVDEAGSSNEFPRLRTESTPSNLPAPVKSFVGRTAELEQLEALLEASRLVTITGPGGAGKTSLALQAARAHLADYPGGVWLIELARITDGKLIPTELLGAMSRPAPADADPTQVLTRALASETALLVMDNCEHVLADAAKIAAAVLRAAPEVDVLATSREALQLGGEQIWAIPTLGLPQRNDPASVVSSDAGRLFVERAKSADGSFEIHDRNAATIAEICRRLDGLPLAIELAAARTRSMSVPDIDRRLADRFKLLRGGSRDEVPHHRTLQESVAWSFDLLSPEQQSLFTRLCVFAGGFDLDAAEAVDDTGEVIDGLDHLVAQSLLGADRGEPTRYHMLETMRQYGAERLEDAGLAHATRLSHFEWIAALAREGARQLEGPNQVTWLKKFRLEIDNIRAALGWAREHDPVAGAGVVAALTRFFWSYAADGDSTAMRDSTSFLQEGYDWATSLLQAAGDGLPAKLRGRLQLGIGGLLCLRTGRFDEALERLDEAAAILRAEGDMRNVAWATFYTACAGAGIVSRENTIDTWEESVRLHTDADDKFGVFIGTLLISLYEIGRNPERARQKATWALEAALHSGVPNLIAHGKDAVAQVDASLGVVTTESKQRSAEALLTFRTINNYACTSHALYGAGCVLAAEGELDAAARTWGVAEATRRRLSMVLPPFEGRDRMMSLIIGDDFDGPAWQAAKASGATLEPDEGIDWVVTQLGFDPAMLLE